MADYQQQPSRGARSSAQLGPLCRSATGDVMLCADAACGWLGRCLAFEPMQPGEARDCRHGQLARVCERCEDAREIAELRAENAKLRTVMVAAAEEIQAHWEAHCDAEGYGPANLMRRLEEGIPSEYGYTAGAFAELREALQTARADEAHCWAGRVEALTAQLREVDARYMALLKAVADGVAMQPKTVVLNVAPSAKVSGAPDET